MCDAGRDADAVIRRRARELKSGGGDALQPKARVSGKHGIARVALLSIDQRGADGRIGKQIALVPAGRDHRVGAGRRIVLGNEKSNRVAAGSARDLGAEVGIADRARIQQPVRARYATGQEVSTLEEERTLFRI
jgi:hypothetical protein